MAIVRGSAGQPTSVCWHRRFPRRSRFSANTAALCPQLASRNHSLHLRGLVEKALADAGRLAAGSRCLAEAVAIGLTDEEAALLAEINPDTMTEWRKDPEFSGAIKRATAQRLLLRLERIEAG